VEYAYSGVTGEDTFVYKDAGRGKGSWRTHVWCEWCAGGWELD